MTGPANAGEENQPMATIPQSGSLRVSWTPEAESALQLVIGDPAVREELKRNAEVTLHEIEASGGGDLRSEGREGELMWHRGWDHEQEHRPSWYAERADDGPWNYVLFYRRTAGPAEFQILAVRSRLQIADRIWEKIQNRKWWPPTWRNAGSAHRGSRRTAMATAIRSQAG
jgi:hypothetical protein